MILKAWDARGERVVSTTPTRADIAAAVESLDWDTRHIVGVTLMHDDRNWADGSGSMQAGLSLMLEEDGMQYVSEEEPADLAGIVDFLDVYLSYDLHKVHEFLAGTTLSPEELEQRKAEAPDGADGGTLGCLALIALVAIAVSIIVMFVI